MKRLLLTLLILTFLVVLVACEEEAHGSFDDRKDTGSEKIDSSEPISDKFEPEEIAAILVEQQMMENQIKPKDWEITEIGIYSDKEIENIADYGKPVGKMRVVWVTGYVYSKVNDTEVTENFDLELYKLDEDNVWYIDKHWGALRAIDVSEMPRVDESNYQLSTSDEIPVDDEYIEDSYINDFEINHSELEGNEDRNEYFAELEQRYLEFVYEHFTDIGLIQYLDGGKFFLKDVDIFENPPAISDRREYTYFLEGTLNSDFNALTEKEQFDLLSNLNVVEYFEFYEGHQFTVASVELSNGSDIFVKSSGSLEKNGESFWHQLENPFDF